jgi:hypothetical protein
MALNTEIWIKSIQETLFPDNAFYKASVNHTEYVNNKTVHVPNSGDLGNVLVDNTSYPQTALQRTDTEVTYSMNEFKMPPYFVSTLDQAELSYEKMSSITRQMASKIEDAVANKVVYNWTLGLPAASKVVTTGSARAANLSFQTGTRKALTFADVLNIQKKLNQQNVPNGGRKLLVSAGFYADLVQISQFQNVDSLMAGILTNGALGRIAGFDVYVRGEYNVYYDASGTTSEVTTSTGATFNDIAIAWHPDFVGTAMGTPSNGGIKFFLENGSATYYSDLVSAYTRHGSKRLRTDDKGVILVYEGV